jgi:Na+-translocating ferredoxin:NAD+ oxidoreductase subunit B
MNHLEIASICIACDNCRVVCPEKAIISNGKEYYIEKWSCTLCNLCIEVCPIDCIKIIEKNSQSK